MPLPLYQCGNLKESKKEEEEAILMMIEIRMKKVESFLSIFIVYFISVTNSSRLIYLLYFLPITLNCMY
jgi:hypothetical protein